MSDTERETYAVTPPRTDSPRFRGWAEDKAAGLGWTDLRWSEEIDAHGQPMGRLTGVRPEVGK